MIIYDTREKCRIPEMIRKARVYSREETLKAGDYLIPKPSGGNILVERSSFHDFVGKIISGRLWIQVEKCLDAEVGDTYFIIEGPFDWRNAGMRRKAIISAMVALTRKVKVLMTMNENDTFTVLEKMNRSYSSDHAPDIREFNSRVAPRVMDEDAQAEWVLQGLEGVGPKIAAKILRKAGSLAKVMEISEEEFLELGKVGKSVYRVLHKPYRG